MSENELMEFQRAFLKTTQGKWTDMGMTVSSDTEGRPTVVMAAHSPYHPRNLHECEANAEWIAAIHNAWPAIYAALKKKETRGESTL